MLIPNFVYILVVGYFRNTNLKLFDWNIVLGQGALLKHHLKF